MNGSANDYELVGTPFKPPRPRGRLASLLPDKAERYNGNPIELIASLSRQQHLLFLCGFFAWLMDAYNFASVALTMDQLADEFSRPIKDIAFAVTLMLLPRSIGAIIFGLLADRAGRRWPLAANMLLIAILQFASSQVMAYRSFLITRALFGVGMGGVWGLAASTALEDLPLRCRGLYSGIMQEGYDAGFLLASCVNLFMVSMSYSWRRLFQVGAALSATAAVFRALLPESQTYLEQRRKRKSSGTTTDFLLETWRALRNEWQRCIYAVALMAGFNCFAHASQDIYPTYLIQGKLFSEQHATLATIIATLGAICGGVAAGFLSQTIGRRLAIIASCLWVLIAIPLWTLPSSFSMLTIGAFLVQAGVGGAFSVAPVYLLELSPPELRAVWPGLAYQLGNAFSSVSSQLEATGAEHLRTTVEGRDVPDYARILQISIAGIAIYLIVLAAVGVEAREESHDIQMEGRESDIEEKE